MIAAEKTNFPVAVLCRVLGVSRTGFHNWEHRAPSDRALQDAWLTDRIKLIHERSRGVYGAPRIRPRKRWRTTIRIPGITPATDLVERDFNEPLKLGWRCGPTSR